MRSRSYISLFLLQLVLLAGWHNAVVHSHSGEEESFFFAKKGLETHHDHPHRHHHHPAASWWEWVQLFFGKLDHPDMGKDHLELFPARVAAASSVFHQKADLEFLLPFVSDRQDGQSVQTVRNRAFGLNPMLPIPPLLGAFSNRGPPFLS